MVQPPYPFRIKPWNIYRGDDSQYPISDGYSDGTVDTDGQPVLTSMADLTDLGDTWTCQVKRSTDAAPIDVTVDDSNADGSGGVGVPQLLLTLIGDTTLAMSIRDPSRDAEPDYYCDVQVSGGAISPRTIYRFDVFLVPDVTQP